MKINGRVLGVSLLIAAVSSFPSQYLSGLENQSDDGLRRALMSIQRQRRQMAARNSYYDSAYEHPSSDITWYNRPFGPQEEHTTNNNMASTRAENIPDDDNIPYRAILEEIIRKMRNPEKDQSEKLPANHDELQGVFGPSIDGEDDGMKSSDDEALNDLFKTDEGSDDREKEADESRIVQVDDNGGDYQVRKRVKYDKRGDANGESEEITSESPQEVEISYEDLKTDLILEENKRLLDALDMATLSQITGSSALIPSEIESIRKAIRIEDILKGIEAEEQSRSTAGETGVEQVGEAERKRGGQGEEEDTLEEPVLERVHHQMTTQLDNSPLKGPGGSYGKLPWQPTIPESINEDTCPVMFYEFNCDYAVSLGEQFVDLCRRHDICYSCGGVHDISHEGCDEGFLAEGDQLCTDDWCKLAAAQLFLKMKSEHRRIPDTEDLQECSASCVEQYIVFGDF